MNLTKTELQLVALALNAAAQPGEVSNSASALFRSLRKRKIKAEQFAANESLASSNRILEASVKSYRATINTLRINIDQLTRDNQSYVTAIDELRGQFYEVKKVLSARPPPLPSVPPPLPSRQRKPWEQYAMFACGLVFFILYIGHIFS